MNDIQKVSNLRKLSILKSFKEFDIQKAQKVELKSSCGIVFNGKQVLLGLSNADDDRNGKWCFPGGGIETNEDCISAAIRETYEEMNLVCKALTNISMMHVIKPNVAFCILNCDSFEDIKPNEEFDKYDFFDVSDLPENILSINKDILNMVNYKVIKNL